MTKTAFQDPDSKLFEVDGKRLTLNQLKALQKLCRQVSWVIIKWEDPKQENN